MKKKDLYDAISGIDEKYLSDSENFSEISVEFRRAKARKIGTFFSLCSCSLIIVVTVFLNSDVMGNNFNNIPEIIEKSETIQTDIPKSSDIIIKTETAESNSEISTDLAVLTENTSILTNENPVESSKKTIAADVSDDVNGTDNLSTETVQTENPTIETPVTDIVTTYDNTVDGYNQTDFSGISVDEWLENPDVVWSGSDTKGYLNSEYIRSGNAKISEQLYDLMQDNADNKIYAVMVDFSSCIDESELLNWEYNGNTISDLKLRISEVTEYSENSYKYVDSDGIEHVEYFLTSESEEKVTEIEYRINEIKSAYRDVKIQEFRSTFHDNGLEIYSDRISGIQEENFCFYTFAAQSNLKEFKCRDDEAFIFYPANYFK